MIEKYFSDKQLKQLDTVRQELGDKVISDVEVRWNEIFGGIKQLMSDGKAADCQEAIQLGKKALDLIELFTGGDDKLKASLNNMQHSEGGANMMAQGGHDVTQAEFDFLSHAMGNAQAS